VELRIAVHLNWGSDKGRIKEGPGSRDILNVDCINVAMVLTLSAYDGICTISTII
jgi:hypothetical protein